MSSRITRPTGRLELALSVIWWHRTKSVAYRSGAEIDRTPNPAYSVKMTPSGPFTYPSQSRVWFRPTAGPIIQVSCFDQIGHYQKCMVAVGQPIEPEFTKPCCRYCAEGASITSSPARFF